MTIQPGDIILLKANIRVTEPHGDNTISLLILAVEPDRDDPAFVRYHTLTLLAPDRSLQRNFRGAFTQAGQQGSYGHTQFTLGPKEFDGIMEHPPGLSEAEMDSIRLRMHTIDTEIEDLHRLKKDLAKYLPSLEPEDNTRKLTLGEL